MAAIKVTTDPLSSLYDDIKEILDSLVIKYSYNAEMNETLENRRSSDVYFDAKNQTDSYESHIYTVKEFRNAVMSLYNLTSLTSEWEVQIYKWTQDLSSVPDDMKKLLLENRRKDIVENYVEKNDYYRMLNGYPNIDDKEFFYIDDKLIKDLSLEDLNLKVYNISEDVPIHKIEETYGLRMINILDSLGVVDKLKEKYPDKTYLNFLGENRIDLERARTAKNFQILRINKSVREITLKAFYDLYEQSRVYFINKIFIPEHRNSFTYYDNFIALCIMTMTIQQLFARTISYAIDREFFDDYMVQLLYGTYGIPYESTLSYTIQRRIVKNLNLLVQNKATNKVIYDVAYLLGFHDITINKYYLVKERKFDSKGNLIYVMKNASDGNGYDLYEDSKGNLYGKTEDENGNIIYVDSDGIQYAGNEVLHEVLTEDLAKMYDVYFQKVPLDTKDIYQAITNRANREDYETITMDDPLWWNDSEDLLSEIYESEYNFAETKYLGLTISYKLTELLFENILLMRMVFDLKDSIEDITLQLPNITADTNQPLFDVIVFMCAAISKKYGLAGEIVTNPTGIMHVLDYNEAYSNPDRSCDTLGFNFKAVSLENIKHDECTYSFCQAYEPYIYESDEEGRSIYRDEANNTYICYGKHERNKAHVFVNTETGLIYDGDEKLKKTVIGKNPSPCQLYTYSKSPTLSNEKPLRVVSYNLTMGDDLYELPETSEKFECHILMPKIDIPAEYSYTGVAYESNSDSQYIIAIEPNKWYVLDRRLFRRNGTPFEDPEKDYVLCYEDDIFKVLAFDESSMIRSKDVREIRTSSMQEIAYTNPEKHFETAYKISYTEDNYPIYLDKSGNKFYAKKVYISIENPDYCVDTIEEATIIDDGENIYYYDKDENQYMYNYRYFSLDGKSYYKGNTKDLMIDRKPILANHEELLHKYGYYILKDNGDGSYSIDMPTKKLYLPDAPEKIELGDVIYRIYPCDQISHFDRNFSEVQKFFSEEDKKKMETYTNNFIINKNASTEKKIKDFNEMYSDIKGLFYFISDKLSYTTDANEYHAYKNLYTALYIMKEENKMFKKGYTEDAEIADTFLDYLEAMNPTLADFIKESTEIGLYQAIDHCIAKLENLVGNLNSLYLANDGTSSLQMYLIKLIRFFKSYTTDLIGLGIVYVFDFKPNNMLRLIDKVAKIHKVIGPEERNFKFGKYDYALLHSTLRTGTKNWKDASLHSEFLKYYYELHKDDIEDLYDYSTRHEFLDGIYNGKVDFPFTEFISYVDIIKKDFWKLWFVYNGQTVSDGKQTYEWFENEVLNGRISKPNYEQWIRDQKKKFVISEYVRYYNELYPTLGEYQKAIANGKEFFNTSTFKSWYKNEYKCEALDSLPNLLEYIAFLQSHYDGDEYKNILTGETKFPFTEFLKWRGEKINNRPDVNEDSLHLHDKVFVKQTDVL